MDCDEMIMDSFIILAQNLPVDIRREKLVKRNKDLLTKTLFLAPEH